MKGGCWWDRSLSNSVQERAWETRGCIKIGIEMGDKLEEKN